MDNGFDLERVRTEHSDLVDGLESLYRTLITMAWFDDDQIQWAPHHGPGKTPLAIERLLAAGVDQDVVALSRLLPLPTAAMLSKYHVVGVRALAFSTVVDYYEKGAATSIDDMRQFGINGTDPVLLPSWALLLFRSQGGSDQIVVYDLRNSKSRCTFIPQNLPSISKALIDELPETISELSLYQPTVPELEAAARPAVVVLREWQYSFRSLQWIPWRTSDHMSFIEVRPRGFEALIAEPDSMSNKYQIDLLSDPPYGGGPAMFESRDEAKRHLDEINKARCNDYWARRLVFDSSGWPANFDKQLCRQKIEAFGRDYKSVTDPRIHGYLAKQIGDRQQGGGLREFYRQKAGHYALPKSS